MTNTEEYRKQREQYLAKKEAPLASGKSNKKKVASKIPRNTPAQKKAIQAKWAKSPAKFGSRYNAYTQREGDNTYVGK